MTNPYDKSVEDEGESQTAFLNPDNGISNQILNHIKHLSPFDVNRVNSLHHGEVLFEITEDKLFYRILTIQDHLQKNGLPPKPNGFAPLTTQMYDTIANNRGIYNDVKNGKIVFFVRNWRIFKQEIHLSQLEKADMGDGVYNR